MSMTILWLLYKHLVHRLENQKIHAMSLSQIKIESNMVLLDWKTTVFSLYPVSWPVSQENCFFQNPSCLWISALLIQLFDFPTFFRSCFVRVLLSERL